MAIIVRIAEGMIIYFRWYESIIEDANIDAVQLLNTIPVTTAGRKLINLTTTKFVRCLGNILYLVGFKRVTIRQK